MRWLLAMLALLPAAAVGQDTKPPDRSGELLVSPRAISGTAGPRRALRGELSWVLSWPGGPADVSVVEGERSRLLGRQVSSPFTSPVLPDDVTFVVQQPGEAPMRGAAQRVFGPVSIAGWSGPGLRGADVVGIHATPRAVWAATARGGVGLWEGQRWRHLSPSQGLPRGRVHDFAMSEGARWLAHDDGLTMLTSDGVLHHWTTDSPVVAVALPSADRAWFIDQQGVWEASTAGRQHIIDDAHCTSLFAHDSGWAASCSDTLSLPSGDPIREIPEALDVRAIIPRDGGAWIATATHGLLERIGSVATPWWAPPSGTLVDATRIDLGMLFATLEGGLWHMTDDIPRQLTLAHGLPSDTVYTVVGEPSSKAAWVGTARGVALAQANDAVFPLPLAPLAVGIDIHAVVPHKNGEAAIASEDGLVWLGRDHPAGWDTLVAAAGRQVVDIVRDPFGGWWSMSGTTALRLMRGELSRWELHDEVIAGATTPDGVVVATTRGLRWWVDGAERFSPTENLSGVRAVEASDAGIVWALHDDAVTAFGLGRQRTWLDLGEVQHLSADPLGAWVSTTTGTHRLATNRAQTGQLQLAGPVAPIAAVRQTGGTLRVLDQHLNLWTRTRGVLRATSLSGDAPSSQVIELIPDDSGTWIITEHGLYRVVDPPR